MIIRLKDNSPMPSCAIWLGDSLIKPAEDTGGKIYDFSLPSLFTLDNNEIYSNWKYDGIWPNEGFYNAYCFSFKVKDMKDTKITLNVREFNHPYNNDGYISFGKWDMEYTEPTLDETKWTQIYDPFGSDPEKQKTMIELPVLEDNNEHTLQIWIWTGYYLLHTDIAIYPASLVEGVQSRFTADGYYQTYENEKYVRNVKLVEEVKQQDGTWKKDGYEIEGDIDLEYDGKVWAYWTDPKLKAVVHAISDSYKEAPIKAEDFSYINNLTFKTGVTSIDYIAEDIPINSNANRMFQNCSKLTTVPYFSLTGVTNAEYMFDGCTNLQTVPSLPFKNDLIVGAYNMFRNCSSLKEINFKDTTKAVYCIGMFYGCENLEKISGLTYYYCESVSYMFDFCKKLYDIGGTINLSRIYKTTLGTAFDGMFNGTTYLSDIRFSGTLRDSLSLGSHLTQRSIKELIKACSEPLDTDAKTLTFNANTVLINDEPDTYTPLINQAIESGWTFSNLNIVEPADVVGFRYTTTDGRKLNPDHFYNTTSGYTNSCQTDGENGLVLWKGDHSDGLRIYIDDSYNGSNFKDFGGFINKTRFSGAFHICYQANENDARWDFTNADFSGASIDDFRIEMRGCSQDGIYNLDLSGFDTSKLYDNLVIGCETKNLRLTGSLDYSFKFNVGASLNKESVKTILQACANSQNTDAKTLHTDVTMKYLDIEGDLTELLNQAIAKGWTVEGIQIVAKDEAVCLSYTTTDGEIPQKFIEQGNDRTVITSEYGKYYLLSNDYAGNYDINWDNIDTLKTFDGASKEFKCRGVNVPYCYNLTKFDSKNIKYNNDGSGYNPERWRRCQKLQDCINLDFSEYTGQDLNSMFAECWDSVPNITFVGPINTTIDFRNAGKKFTYESIMSILTACAATTSTDPKRCLFDNASTVSSKELTALIKTCTDKGWSFEGLTLENFKLNFKIVSGDTWDNSSVTAYDADGNIMEPLTKSATEWEYADIPAKFMSTTATSAQNITNYTDTDIKVKWTSTAYLFGNSEELSSVNLPNMNTDECETMAGMFYNCPKLYKVDMSSINFINVTDTSDMFNGCSMLNRIVFTQANFSEVKNHTDMFKGCDNLTKIVLKDSNEATYNMLSAALTEAGKDPAIISTGNTYTNYIYSDPLEDEAKDILDTGIKIGTDIKFRVTGRNAGKHCGSVWAGYNGDDNREERLFSYATNIWMFDCGASRIDINIADARPDYGDGSLLDFTCGNNYMIDNITGIKYTNNQGEQTDFEDENFGINLKTFYTNSLQIWKNNVLVFDAHVTDDDRFIDNITGTDVPNSQNYQFKKFLDEE